MLSQRELVEAGWQQEGIGTGAKPGAATAAASQVRVGSIASGDQTHCCPQNSLKIQGEGHSGASPPKLAFLRHGFGGKLELRFRPASVGTNPPPYLWGLLKLRCWKSQQRKS